MASGVDPQNTARTKQRLEQALFEIRRVIAGQDQMLERVLVCLLTGGHLLIEGVPGLAKTLTVKTTANVLGGTFNRIQFTPDLVPSDLIGTRIYRADNASFDTELGPVFCNFLLADEINRAPAKVQSALLEVMQERQVTLGHTTHPVPDPFLVMATQNPIESEGTYPLPEAQVDRFMLKILVDYPLHDEELTVIQRSLVAPPELKQLLSIDELRDVQAVGARDLRRSGPRQLRAPARDRDAPPGRVRAARSRALHLVRRQPARADLADPRRARRSRSCAGATTCSCRTCRSSSRTRCATAWCSRTRRWPSSAAPTACSTRSSPPCRSRSSTSPGTPRDRRAPPPGADPCAARARARCPSRCCARST